MTRAGTRLWRGFFAATVAASLLVTGAGAAAAASPPSQPLLLAFHSCSAGGAACFDPRNHVVRLAQGSDGASWTLVPGWTPYSGSVPDVFRRGDTIYIYTPSGVVRMNARTGAVTPQASVRLTDGSLYVDPSVAQLPDGRLVLFYLPGQLGMDPAGCGGAASCVREIRSAVEVVGSDGTVFTPSPNPHVSATLTSGTFSDPDVFHNGDSWVLYVSRGPSTEAYVSPDLLGSYVKAGDVTVNEGGVPAALRLDDGSVLTLVSAGTSISAGSSPRGTTSLNGALRPVLTPGAVTGAALVGSPGLAANTGGIALASSTTTKKPVSCRKGKVTKTFTGNCPKGWKLIRRA